MKPDMPAPARNHKPNDADRIEAIEMPLLLEAMFQRYGYDFRDYAPASLRRRIHRAMTECGVATLSAYQDRVLRDPAAMAGFLDVVSVDVSGMFRDPGFYRALHDKVLPQLAGMAHLRVWLAGCAGGEEVYSMAILLHESGLLERAQLYATDLNPRVLGQGRNAIYPIRHMQEYTANYLKAGGKAAFSDYYTAKHEGAILADFLRQKIVWAEHNMVSDGSFNEFQIVLCRNVMIYFNTSLQARVHRLLHDSLMIGGALGLGHGESLQFTAFEECYEAIDRDERLYRRLR
jgi:chemotaxis protein methyltransferase CheR